MSRRPRLRDDLIIVEQRYRGDQTYIVKDPRTHKYFRFKPLEVLIMQQFRGEHTVEELADGLEAQGMPVPVRSLQGFADRLRRMELLERTLGEKSVLQLERLRAERHRRVKGTHYNGSLLRMRWSMGDPDRLFDRWMPWLRLFFTPAFFAVSVALFAVYFAVAVVRFEELGQGVIAMYTAEFYTLQNILLFWGTAMVVIAIHELGHGVTCKYFGGQVHEMGAMLIYFQPAFYCNVNDAWTFPKLSHRLWVTAAGSWIQLVVAGLAAILWVVVDPGTVVSRVAFFAVLVGGATTILANANPLIPLDGYYALSDWLEIPNLRQRALGYVAWLVKRKVLRLQAPEPDADPRERRIFVTYGMLAILYITTILTVVAMVVGGWLSGAFGALGVFAFVLLLWAMLRTPLREWGRNVVNALREHRAFLTARPRLLRWGGTAALLLLACLVIPWPLRVHGAFIVRPALVVPLEAADDGVLAEVAVSEGEPVGAGASVARLWSPALSRTAAALTRAADSLQREALRARVAGDREAARTAELAAAEAAGRLAAVRERLDRLAVRAPVGGTVVTARFGEHVGREYEAGDVIAELAAGAPEALARLDRAGAGYVRAGQPVRLLIPVGIGRTLRGEVSRVLAAAPDPGALDVRIRVVDGAVPPLGTRGEAVVTVGRSNILGALWWGIRTRLRNDLLL